jgi:UDP-2,3-diacylglucosamine hydrolase
MSTDAPIGLIAGTGQLPLLSAATMKATGRKVVVMGLRGLGDPRLSEFADVFAWRSLTRLSGWIRYFRKHGVREVVMIGGVQKRNMYSPFRLITHLPDLRTMRIWYQKVRKDKRDNAVLLAVADELSTYGIELISSVEYLNEHLADDGLMTSTSVPPTAQGDVDFGWDIARQSAKLDIGQSLAVKERDIIAVEAIEGTDAMIRRAGRLCRMGGWVLIKVARPEQDMRFDVPTVGPDTIRRLKDAKCRCLVVQAGRTLIADKPNTLALADELGIAVVGKTAD